MGKYTELLCYFVVIISSALALFRYIHLEGTSLDYVDLPLIVFGLIFLHGCLMFYREQRESVDRGLLVTLRFTGILVQTMALSLYTTEILTIYKINNQMKYAPVFVGSILTLLYVLKIRKEEFVEMLVYMNALILIVVGFHKTNYLLLSSGILFGIGQYIFEHSKMRLALYPHQQFNYFLSAFTLCAAEALVQAH